MLSICTKINDLGWTLNGLFQKCMYPPQKRMKTGAHNRALLVRCKILTTCQKCAVDAYMDAVRTSHTAARPASTPTTYDETAGNVTQSSTEFGKAADIIEHVISQRAGCMQMIALPPAPVQDFP